MDVVAKGHGHFLSAVMAFLVGFCIPVISFFSATFKSIFGSSIYAAMLTGSLVISIACSFLLVKRRTSDLIFFSLFLIPLILIFLIHVYSGSNLVEEGQVLLYFAFAILVFPALDEELFLRLCKTIVLISFIITADAILSYFKLQLNGDILVNLRTYTLVDKPGYTVAYSIAPILLANSLFDNTKTIAHKVGISICISVELFVGLFLIQSKTFVLVLFVAGVVACLLSRKKSLYWLLFIAGLLCLLGIFFVGHFFPNAIPESYRPIVNKIFGLALDFDPMYLKTYSMRSQIAAYAFSLLEGNVMFGIGFGGFAESVIANGVRFGGHTILETESSILSFVVEGGFLFFLIWVLCMIFSIYGLSLKYKREFVGQCVTSLPLILLISYSILLAINDFANPLYFIFVAFFFKWSSSALYGSYVNSK